MHTAFGLSTKFITEKSLLVTFLQIGKWLSTDDKDDRLLPGSVLVLTDKGH